MSIRLLQALHSLLLMFWLCDYILLFCWFLINLSIRTVFKYFVFIVTLCSFFCHKVEDLSCQKKDTGISFWFMCLQNYRTDLCSALAIMSSVAESNAILPSNSLIKRREDMSHMTLPLAAIACQQRRCQTHWVQIPAFQSYIIENPPILGLPAGTFPAWLEACRLTEEKKKQWVKSKSFPRW